MTCAQRHNKTVVTPVYRRIYTFYQSIHSLLCLSVHVQPLYIHLLFSYLQPNTYVHKQFKPCNYFKFLKPGMRTSENAQLTFKYFFILRFADFALWIGVFLLCLGDIHPNPGPASVPSASSSSKYVYRYIQLSQS